MDLHHDKYFCLIFQMERLSRTLQWMNFQKIRQFTACKAKCNLHIIYTHMPIKRIGFDTGSKPKNNRKNYTQCRIGPGE